MSEPAVNELTATELAVAEFNTTVANLTDAVQAYMDTIARDRNYDCLLSACTYATSSHIPFSKEGKACVEWRDTVWIYCYKVLSDVQMGLRAVPTAEQLISELPPINWDLFP